ncbi:sigma-E processing peptidase SpoIIGA [Geomicrobium sp. JCM 19039]|uniref:sigma-E processing peptidase SpoIIGA n=1 Tax=Geomicrobium sp. JCM 19039 TaxID=1460636 RepID=UPI0005A5FBF9|nr:sigma-E processing peptidase SpoIIGA [Geomicrobium sp. JCM 19039]
MTLYIDIIYGLNTIVTISLLYMTGKWVGYEIKPVRIVCTALVTGLPLFLWMTDYSVYLASPISQFFICLGAVLLAFGFQTFWRLFKTVAAFYFISILSGGAVVAMSWVFQSSALVQSWRATSTWHLLDHMHALLVLSTIPVVLILSEIVKRAVKEDKKMMKKLVRVSIRMTEADDWIHTCALVDTGNQLKDPISRKPVVLAEASIVRPLLDEASFAQFIEWIATDGSQGANL